jgi:diadenosine tetraphosphate (Ap4A) HIT family hydrolase
VATYFDLTDEERQSIHKLLEAQRETIEAEDSSVEGFNIGWNCGEVAGQTVFHAHVHLIPRRKNDVENPVGGIRHLIPGKGNYEAE